MSITPEMEQAAQDAVDASWEMYADRYPGVTRPDVDLVRYVEMDEWASASADCMNEEGYPTVTAGPDGGLESPGLTDEQMKSYRLSMYICDVKYQLHPRYNLPLTDKRLGVLYDYFLNDLAPCLRDRGYTVPEAPSRETFIESYVETGGWDVYANVPGGGQQQWDDTNSACPQIPTDFYD